MSTYDPNSVSSGYLGFLQSAEMISNLIFASIIAVAVLFAVFVLINGRAKLSDGFSGKLIQRWSVGDVVLHWCAAVPCIILILSGFVIGAGKVWLAPMMTPAHFHSLVYASVLFHNIFAIPFIIAAVILMVKWSRNQLPESGDGKWFLALGGYINLGGKPKHPDAGFANAGEKAFFWTFTIFGLALVVTGLLLLFPGLFGTLSKNGALLALIIHICSAIILGAFSVVHIYMGAVMSDLQNRRAMIMGMESDKGFDRLNALVPLAELYRYSTTLSSLTSGSATYTMKFASYEQVPADVQDKLLKAYTDTDEDPA